MRNIYIMANGRTGSSFLSGHFSTIDNDEGLESNQYNAWEFFAMWFPNFWRNLHFLKNNDIQIPESHINCLINSYYYKPNKMGKPIYDEFPYTLDMVTDFANAIKPLGLNYFLHKHITHATTKGSWDENDIIKDADFILINYRGSVLDAYISQVKASESQLWMTRKYTKKYDKPIYWNKELFIEYAEEYKEKYERIMDAVIKSGKPFTTFKYEDLVKMKPQERIEYIRSKVTSIGIGEDIDLVQPNIKKQSKKREYYEDCFGKYHKRDFMNQYSEIKHLTRYNIDDHQ